MHRLLAPLPDAPLAQRRRRLCAGAGPRPGAGGPPKQRAGADPKSVRRAHPLPAAALALVLAFAGLASAATGAVAQPPTLAAPLVVAGPSANIDALSGLSLARDGTGGIVFLETVSGEAHVFVSRLIAGAFQPPVQVDGSLAGPSSQPVIAAGRGGVLVIAFVNGGSLYTVDVRGASWSVPAPAVLFTGASNPAIQMTDFGKAYLVFTANDGAGSDVRAAYYFGGAWSLEPTPLNVTAGDDAGLGSGRPAVAAAGDGVALVVWGEEGHVYSRRVWGTMPSAVYQQVDVSSVGDFQEVSSGDASIGAGGNSTYATVVFEEVVGRGYDLQTRVLARELDVATYSQPTPVDGPAPPYGPQSADQPRIAVGEYSHGLITTETADTNEVLAATIGDGGAASPAKRLDSLANATPPDPAVAAIAYYDGLVAWQHDSGDGAAPEIRASYYYGSSFGTEEVISSPELGPTDAARGLEAAGDLVGDVVVAWVQGYGPASQIVAAQILVGPSSFAATKPFQYVNTTTPVLSWSAPSESLGSLIYSVSVNGTAVAQTTGTSVGVPLPQGPSTWQVSALNLAGLNSVAKPAEIWVDTVAPAIALSVSGKQQIGSKLLAAVSFTDAPPPEPPADAAGIASASINWGDGSVIAVANATYAHAYSKPGTYVIAVTVTDRAGNSATATREVRIVPRPEPKPKPKPKPKHKHKPRPKPKPKHQLIRHRRGGTRA